MTKKEWGTKRKCVKCGTSFYDMCKKEFTCPKCGKQYSLEQYTAATLKKILKSTPKQAPVDDENLDEETLLTMEEGELPQENFVGEDGLDVLEGEEENDSEDSLKNPYSSYPEDEDNE